MFPMHFYRFYIFVLENRLLAVACCHTFIKMVYAGPWYLKYHVLSAPGGNLIPSMVCSGRHTVSNYHFKCLPNKGLQTVKTSKNWAAQSVMIFSAHSMIFFHAIYVSNLYSTICIFFPATLHMHEGKQCG